MVPEKKKEIKRVLCKIAELNEINPDQIKLDRKSMELLELNNSHISTNYGSIKIIENSSACCARAAVSVKSRI